MFLHLDHPNQRRQHRTPGEMITYQIPKYTSIQMRHHHLIELSRIKPPKFLGFFSGLDNLVYRHPPALLPAPPLSSLVPLSSGACKHGSLCAAQKSCAVTAITVFFEDLASQQSLQAGQPPIPGRKQHFWLQSEQIPGRKQHFWVQSEQNPWKKQHFWAQSEQHPWGSSFVLLGSGLVYW